MEQEPMKSLYITNRVRVSRVANRPSFFLDRPEIAATVQKKEEDISG